MVQIVQGTGNSPEIIIDAESAFIAMRGMCLPESGRTLFEPLVACVDDIMQSSHRINMVFELKYFNSVSAQYLFKIFERIIQVLAPENIRIEWKYDPDDDDNKMKGEFFSELSGIPFEFIEIEEEQTSN